VLYEAILKNTEHEGPVGSVGRMGAAYYNKLGYIPYDVDIRENVARSLDMHMRISTSGSLDKIGKADR
jgi:putative alpha-1,2-mannosidase